MLVDHTQMEQEGTAVAEEQANFNDFLRASGPHDSGVATSDVGDGELLIAKRSALDTAERARVAVKFLPLFDARVQDDGAAASFHDFQGHLGETQRVIKFVTHDR